MNDQNNNTFYLAFKDVNPSLSLIGIAFLAAITVTLAIIFNSSVILVTIRTKSLHGTANYLLALCSFFEMLHELGNLLFIYNAFSGQNFIELRLASKILFIPSFGYGGVFVSMIFTGIDRLLAIVFPKIHNCLKIRLYLTFVTIISVLYGFLASLLHYREAQHFGDLFVTGSYVDLFKSASPLDSVIILLLIMTCIVYLIVGISIRIKATGLPSADQINRRTFRALFCIIAVNIGGYFISLFYLSLIKPLISSPITAWFFHVFVSFPLLIGAASNGPILYFTSLIYSGQAKYFWTLSIGNELIYLVLISRFLQGFTQH